MRKNKMHACMKLMALLLTVASVSLGGMHDVYAKGTPQSGKGTIVVVNTASNKSTSTKTNSVNKVPTIEVTVDALASDVKPVAKASGDNVSGSIGGIEYSKLVMANVEEAVNIRSEASEKSKIVGKFYKECGGSILEKGNGWTKVKTGDVTGWIKNDYLLFGSDAKALAEKVVEKIAVSTTSCLRLRKSPSESGEIYGLLAEGDKITVIEEQGDWVKVEYGDGTICYVSAKYVKIESDQLDAGESVEAIAAREKEEKAAAAEASKSAAKSDTSAAAAAASTTPVTVTNNGGISGDVNDVQLLAALIQAEAGREVYQGQVAVGNVVINRLHTGRYGNSLMSVIYAKGQFGPAASGQVAQIYAAGPSASCVAAAQEAMGGTNYVGTATHFRNIKSGYTGIVIGNHVFW